MTLNDFKSVEGDLRMGLKSLPAMLGVDRAGAPRLLGDGAAQVAVVLLLLSWGTHLQAAIGRRPAGRADPADDDPADRAEGPGGLVTTRPAPRSYVLGMLASAFAIGGLLSQGGAG